MSDIIVHITPEAATNVTALHFLPNFWENGENRFFVSHAQREDVVEEIVQDTFTEPLVGAKHLVVSHTAGYIPTIQPMNLSVTMKNIEEMNFHRYSKNYQTVLLRKAVADAFEKGVKFNYYDVPSYFGNSIKAVLDGEWYILKPQNGARGIGFLLFNSSVVTTERLMRLMTIYEGRTVEDCYKDIKELESLYRDSIVYVSDRDRGPMEGFKELQAFPVLAPMVDNVISEYRVITNGYGRPVYYLRRARNTVTAEGKIDFKQACGAAESVNTAVVDLEGFKSLLATRGAYENAMSDTNLNLEQRALFSALYLIDSQIQAPLHSFDVFIREDYSFGIFEFQPQFGASAVPAKLCKAIAQQAIERSF